VRQQGYRPIAYLDKSPALAQVVQLIQADFFSQIEPGLFKPLLDSLLYHDPYMVFADFDDYCRAQDEAEKKFKDPTAWTRSSIVNVAKSGKFSSDRTIAEYARDIWDVPFEKR